MLTREDLINLYEFVHQARLMGVAGQILEKMDLADEAWQDTFDRLEEATHGKEAQP